MFGAPALGEEPVMNVIPQPPADPAPLPSAQDDREALDNWLNEGGHLLPSAAKGSPKVPQEEALRDMASLFISDFANGRVGQHHNTFQHRARILRQLTAELRATPQEVRP
jgi:hypothetical protein